MSTCLTAAFASFTSFAACSLEAFAACFAAFTPCRANSFSSAFCKRNENTGRRGERRELTMGKVDNNVWHVHSRVITTFCFSVAEACLFASVSSLLFRLPPSSPSSASSCFGS